MTAGKRFEEQIKKSCKKQGIFFLRLKDAGGWNRGQDTRFTSNNLCDCIMHYGGFTLLVELKTHLGKSIPQTALKQAGKMAAVEYNGVKPLFILNFRGLNKTYLISAKKVIECLSFRKSVSIQFCEEYGELIEQKKLRTNYEYFLEKTFKKLLT